MFSFLLNRDDISPALSRMARAAKNPAEVFRAMGTTFMSLTMGNFKSDAYRPAAWRSKRDGSESKLQQSGVLSRSFKLSVTATGATVKAPPIYAAIHQYGGVIKSKHGKFLRFKWGPGDADWATVKEVKIPPRPFFPVQNDRLTDKASEKIAAAGQRVIQRQAAP